MACSSAIGGVRTARHTRGERRPCGKFGERRRSGGTCSGVAGDVTGAAQRMFPAGAPSPHDPKVAVGMPGITTPPGPRFRRQGGPDHGTATPKPDIHPTAGSAEPDTTPRNQPRAPTIQDPRTFRETAASDHAEAASSLMLRGSSPGWRAGGRLPDVFARILIDLAIPDAGTPGDAHRDASPQGRARSTKQAPLRRRRGHYERDHACRATDPEAARRGVRWWGSPPRCRRPSCPCRGRPGSPRRCVDPPRAPR